VKCGDTPAIDQSRCGVAGAQGWQGSEFVFSKIIWFAITQKLFFILTSAFLVFNQQLSSI